LLKSASEPHLSYYAVSSAVGSVKNDAPRLVEPM
jgi:hypothetical protein